MPEKNRTRYLIVLFTFLFAPFTHAQDISDVFDQVVHSVVDIRVQQQIVRGTTKMETFTLADQGSGVLISSQGQVITAAHLVKTADSITVRINGGDEVRAKVIASEPAADIALLQLERTPDGAVVAPLGESDDTRIGERVFIIGAPYGLRRTVTVGYISGRHQPLPAFGPFAPVELFKTDAGIHHGSSGAPLFNMKGRVIGIATQVMTTNERTKGLGFAVTSGTVSSLLLERRSLWLGIECYRLSGGLALAFNLAQSEGLLVQRIASHSPGSRLGLQAGTAPTIVGKDKFVLGGDVILAMQGISLAEDHGYERARAALASLKDGETLHFTVLRAGERIELRAPISR